MHRLAIFLAVAASAIADTSVIFIDSVAGVTNVNNRAAKQTPFIQPQGIWVGPTGDLYVSDGNFLVWRVSGGTATIIAGGGDVVDDSIPIPATRAKLDFPSGIVGGPNGEIYFSDVRHNRVRRINADRTIVTVAGTGTAGYSGDGGRATFAELEAPLGLAIGPAGQLYIADSWNYVVRRVDTRTGIISTIAGTGASGNSGDGRPATQARVGRIAALAFDPAGNLYLSDVTNYVVRKVTPDGTISTVAGNGKSGFSGDGGRATQASTTAIYGLAADAKGNLYLSDYTNYRIRIVKPDGTIGTYAGQTSPRNRGAENIPATEAFLDRPRGIALDSSGNLYIGEDYGNLIRRVDAATGRISTFAGTVDPFDGIKGQNAPLIRPTDVAVDSRGNLYIADNGHYRVRRIDAASGIISTVAGDGIEAGRIGWTDNSIGGSLSISIDPQDRLLIADAAEQVVRRVDLATGTMTTIIDLTEDDSEPAAAIADRAGNVYVSDRYYNQIYKFSPGKFAVLAGIEGDAGLTGDGGAAVDALLDGPEGMVLDGNGGLLFCDKNNHVVRRIDLTTGIITRFAGDGYDDSNYDGHPAVEASLGSPIAIATNGKGWVYIADAGEHQIRSVSPEGIIDTLAGDGYSGFTGDGGPAVLAHFDTPLGLAFYGGELYICDSFNYRIRKMFVKDVPLRLQVSPQRFTFRTSQGGAVPSPQLMILQSSYVGLDVTWKLDAPGFTGNWLYASYLTGNTPDVILMSVDPAGLAPGTYTAEMTVASDDTPTVRVPITLVIDPPNVASSVTAAPAYMTFTVPRDGSDSQTLSITSPGGNALDWTANVLTTSPWLKFSARSGTTPSAITISASAAGLEAGSYTAVVYLQSGPGVSLFVVTMVVSPARAVMAVDRDLFLYESVEGSTRALPQTLAILNSGSSDLNWTVDVPADAAWIRPGSASGTVKAGGGAFDLPLLVTPSGLRAGVYSSTLTLRATGALGSPQIVSVRLRVAPGDTLASPVISRTGIVFRGSPGAEIPEQSIEIGSTGGSLSYSALVKTENDKDWLDANPLRGTVASSAQPGTLRFRVNTSGLPEGVHNATVKYAFSDGSVRQLAVVLILKAGVIRTPVPVPLSERRAVRNDGCAASQQVMITTSQTNNFSGVAGWPMVMRAEVYDDCGTPLTDATVTATFTSNDPPKTLSNLKDGQYVATWTPRSAASSVTITLLSKHAVLPSATLKMGGTLTAESSPPPVLDAGGVLNAASRRIASLISPAGRIALTGAYFPTAMSDVTVLINGSPAQVVSTSTGEVGIIAPADFGGASRAAVVVRARGLATSAELVTVVPVDPGLFAPAQPLTAAPGGTLTINATGLGPAGGGGSPQVAVTAAFDDTDAGAVTATASADTPGVYTLKVNVPASVAGAKQLVIKANGAVSNGVPVTVQ